MLIPASSSVCGLITRRPSRGGCVTQPPINLTDVRFQHDTEYFHASSRLCGFLFNRSMWQKHLGMQESFIDNRAVAALTKTHSLTDLQWDSWCGVWFLVLCKQAGAVHHQLSPAEVTEYTDQSGQRQRTGSFSSLWKTEQWKFSKNLHTRNSTVTHPCTVLTGQDAVNV